jgi:hypothetical protein
VWHPRSFEPSPPKTKASTPPPKPSPNSAPISNLAANAPKHTEHWRNHLLELLESRLVERVLNAAGGEGALNQLASDVAERRKDPFAAVNEILAKSGLETPVK